MTNLSQLAVLLKSRGIPAEVRHNGEIESIVIETLGGERLIFAPGENGWGYTLVTSDGLVEVGWIDEVSSTAPAEEVASHILKEIDWVFESDS